MKRISLPDLSTQIQKMLEERQQHADALARIDQILVSVGAAMGAKITKLPGANAATVPTATPAPVVKGKRRRRRGKFATSGEEAILAFMRENKNPTTQDVKKMWADAGRGGRPDNMLSVLTKAKKLKRTPLGKGIAGSRYSLA